LSAALEDIGDFYAIYGFSSHGRRNVEVYPVKTFAEALSPGVKSRIGGIVPRHSTRMGAAVRHATRKLKDVSSRARLLVLLSDGHPEDADYGRDKHAPTYGLRDTMMALREAEKHGILSFCLTVDKGGHDYLREMCAPSRYMVIDDILSLPAELPKIYQRHIRAQSV
jgi:nitric oxide reductase NorD protein